MNGLPVSRRARDVSPWLFPAFSQGTRFFFFLQRRLLKPLRDGGWEKGGEEPFWWRRKVSSFPVDKSGFPFLSLPELFSFSGFWFGCEVASWFRVVGGCRYLSLEVTRMEAHFLSGLEGGAKKNGGAGIEEEEEEEEGGGGGRTFLAKTL